MYKLQINVTKEILMNSRNCPNASWASPMVLSTNCVVALAVRDIFPKAAVMSTKFYPDYSGDIEISLPEEATKFIDEFDSSDPIQRESLEPISFEVDIPDTVIDSIDIEEVILSLENHPTLKLQRI